MSKLALMKWAKPIVIVTRKGLRFISKNSNVILTVVSATGAIASVALAIHGTIKAVKLCEVKQPKGAKEIIKTVWKCYIPTVGMVLLTTVAIIGNGRINARKVAVLTSARAGSQNSLKLLESKMAEEIGPKKAQKVMDAAKSEEAKQNLPKNEKEIIATGNGDNLFYLKDYGQWIYNSYEGVQLAELKLERDIQDGLNGCGNDYVQANNALEYLGARHCLQGEYNGWPVTSFNQGSRKGPKLRISSEWMDVNGKNQIVGTVWFEPEPEPI